MKEFSEEIILEGHIVDSWVLPKVFDSVMDLGGSFARGHSPWADAWNQLYGADATLRWKPLRRAIYHSFVLRSELIWSRTVGSPDQILAVISPVPPVLNPRPGIVRSRPFGFYVSGDYQLGRRWFLGGRFDRLPPVERPAANGSIGLIWGRLKRWRE